VAAEESAPGVIVTLGLLRRTWPAVSTTWGAISVPDAIPPVGVRNMQIVLKGKRRVEGCAGLL
jgi:hypothetical protein